MIEHIVGNLLDAHADVICHQVNCQGVMGAGIAKQIAQRYPDVKSAYLTYCKEHNNSYQLRGSVQIVIPDGATYSVANIFGQNDYGRHDKRYTQYDALQIAFTNLNRMYNGQTIAFPYGFGCGLAGGSWQRVIRLITQCFTDCTVRIYRQMDVAASPFRVIIAGGRDFDDYDLLCEKCDRIFSHCKPTTIICGEARGAHQLGATYANKHGIEVLSIPAQWDLYGKRAGYLRNVAMADRADALVAFWDGQSKGTKHMIQTAEKRCLLTRIIRY